MPTAVSPATSEAHARSQASAAVARRAQELFAQQRMLLTERMDHVFVILMGCQLMVCLIIAVLFAPQAASDQPDPGRYLHFRTAALLALLYTGVPVALALRRPRPALTVHVIAAGQMLMASLLINITGGRIETHFHIFVSLAFLAFYRDWRVLVTAATVVTIDHLWRGIYWPGSVFHAGRVDPLRWLEHTGWVIFETAVLVLSIRQMKEAHWKLMEGRAELEHARDTAEQASQAKDEFLAVLSHELRTPLTPCVMLLSTLVDDERLNAEARDELTIVRRNVDLEARLIDDLLDLTRIAAGKLELVPGHLDLHLLLRQLLETSRGELEAKGLIVSSALEAQHHWVYGDSARLQQVFGNLLKNSIKFTPAGGRIEVRTSDARDRIKVDVIDTGAGISAEVLPKIFQRFEQGGVQVTRQFGGLGLGLSICKAIVELHRGAIRAESRGPSWGSTFTVVIPAREGAAAPKAASQTQRLRLAGKLPRRVLLVDDHPDTRETLARLLTRAGYTVTTADNVRQALQKAGEAKFDILVSDIGLPDGSGCDLMRTIKEQYALPGIAFSGYGMDGDVRKSEEAGFSAHLTKPVDFQRLKDAMSQALAGGAGAASRTTAA